MSAESSSGEVVRLAAPAMGTRFEVVLAGDDAARLLAAGEMVLEEVRALSERLSAFSRGSVLTHVNGHAAGRAVGVDREVFELLMLCRDGWVASEGAFDITVGPLMEAWGFRGRRGSREELERARACVGMEKVELDAGRGTVRFACAGVRLDLGGVAKGYAVDVAVGLLRGAGVRCALLHGGTSSVAAIGSPPGEAGWRVRAGQETVELRDDALSVSAPRGRMVETDDGLIGHVLDPRSGEPSRGATLAWAACDSAAWAEVWSTAMLVLRRRPAGMPAEVRTFVETDVEVCA